METLARLERKIAWTESILIALSIGSIAAGDFFLGQDFSLGYLYLIPLSYSALTYRWPTNLALVVVCVVLRQSFGPVQQAPWEWIVRDWVLTAIYVGVVAALYRFGNARRQFFETARLQRDELKHQVDRAADVQQQLLTRNLPPVGRYDIVARTFPALQVGGDYYDFIPLQDRHVGIVIADVAGKGLSAALLMPAVQIALRALTTNRERLPDMVAELNNVLYSSLERASYCTLFFGKLCLDSGRFTYVNAGHQPALLWRHETQSPDWLHVGGTPAGLLPDQGYETAEVVLGAGDILILYTDGITEAMGPEEEMFGAEQLVEVVQHRCGQTSSEIVQAIYDAVLRFQDGYRGTDDMTVIAVKAPLG